MTKRKFATFKAVAWLSMVVILGGCSINLLPSGDPWYMQHYMIMQDFERSAYKDLTPEAKTKFQNLFWEVRRPESYQEYQRRMEFIMKQFKRENSAQPWNTDRARIFLLNGSPASIEYKQMDAWGISTTRDKAQAGSVGDRSGENIQARTGEGWSYSYEKGIVYYVFAFSPPKSWELVQTPFSGNRYIGELEILNRKRTYGIVDRDKYDQALAQLIEIK